MQKSVEKKVFDQHSRRGSSVIKILVFFVFLGVLFGGVLLYLNQVRKIDLLKEQLATIRQTPTNITTSAIDTTTTDIAIIDTSTIAVSTTSLPTITSTPFVYGFFATTTAPDGIPYGTVYYGTITLTGYASTTKQCENPYDVEVCTKYSDYISFNYDAVSDKNFNDFTGNTTDRTIGLGCYDKSGAKIYSPNFSDDGTSNNLITGDDLATVLGSSERNKIEIEVTRAIYTSGRGAPPCYSHFRNIRVVSLFSYTTSLASKIATSIGKSFTYFGKKTLRWNLAKNGVAGYVDLPAVEYSLKGVNLNENYDQITPYLIPYFSKDGYNAATGKGQVMGVEYGPLVCHYISKGSANGSYDLSLVCAWAKDISKAEFNKL